VERMTDPYHARAARLLTIRNVYEAFIIDLRESGVQQRGASELPLGDGLAQEGRVFLPEGQIELFLLIYVVHHDS
jgi:hypothetical protein